MKQGFETNRAPLATADVTSPFSKAHFCGLEWPGVVWLGVVHSGALLAPLCFTWTGLLLACLLSWIIGGIGICLGFHRLLTHKSFETFRVVRWLLVGLGTLAGEGPPIMWVAAHRRHHQFSDREGDPHSPRDGAWWSHILWMTPRRGSRFWAEQYRQYAPDVLKDPFVRWLNRTYMWWQIVAGVGLFGFGWTFWDTATGISCVVYGLFVRLVYVMHSTWLVNSASHMYGYRNYETPDTSRNLWWVALLTFGEGWHNNHHAFQRNARHGHRWWEIDMTYLALCAMEQTGLAWNVVRARTTPEMGGVPAGASWLETEEGRRSVGADLVANTSP